MRKIAFLVAVIMWLCWTAASAQLVNVTFRANVATVPDTLGLNSVVQIRGTTVTAAGQSADDKSIDTLATGVYLTWDGRSTLFLKRTEGDYWEATFPVPAGSKIAFKFFTNSTHDTVYSGAEWEHKGWEDNLKTPPGIYTNNRGLALINFAGSDTTLPLQFVNGMFPNADQYFRPYTETDSIDVWFRVNMQGWEEFSDQTQVVGVRGAISPGYLGDLSWDHTYVLTQEKKHTNTGQCDYNGKYFWSGRVRIPKGSVWPGQKIEYKFVIMNKSDPDNAPPVREERIPNRSFTISPSKSDTTLHWVWFENKPPAKVVHTDAVNVTFLVDMAQAIQNRGFAFGDTVEARVGYYGTATEVKTIRMRRQGFTTFYKGSVGITTTIGQLLDYQYYAFKLGKDYREVYYNFYYKGETTGEAERRQIVVTGATMTVADTVTSKSDPRRMPFFRNVSVVAQNVLVTYTCDVRPAIYQLLAGSTLKDIQATVNVTHPDSVLAWGLAMNGPATGGWSDPLGGPDWGRHLMERQNKRMYDDGTHGDKTAGDSIFTIQFRYYKDSLDVVGQEFKFGIGGGDNEGGYGNNHIENIDDSQPTCTIASQFGSIDPIFYWAWDFEKQRPATTGVKEVVGNMSLKYGLEQNYPNPFNPVTRIKYSIAKPIKVTLSIYNLLGEQVVLLLDKEQPAGSYEVTWDGRDSRGRAVGSGVYFYKIEAGDFVKTHKMLLLR